MSHRSSSQRRKYSKLIAPPAFLGIPAKFEEFHEQQSRATFDVLDSQQRVRILDAPTGFGKSYIPAIIAAVTGQRVLILTATKLLEDQYERLLGAMGLVDVRGASNYACPALERGEFGSIGLGRVGGGGGRTYAVVKPTADRGPCRVGFSCHYRQEGCPRFDAIRAAREASVVVSNYAYWLSIGKKLRDDGEDEQLGQFDWIFCDEIHLADRQVCNAVTTEISEKHLQLVGLPPLSSNDLTEWKAFAKEAKVRVGGRYDELKMWLRVERDGLGEAIEELRTLKQLERSLDHIITATGKIVVTKGGGTITFEPVWASGYVESLLFRGIANVVGMSATVRPVTMTYLGIDQFDFFDYPSTFPVRNRPIYFMPKYRAHYGMSDKDVRQMIATGDNIFRTRDDRRSIVHSVSYKRARQIKTMSRYADRMVTHEPGSVATERALERFVKGKVDGIFVSPAISTGYDLPDDNAEVCWIPKCPYPSTESEVQRIRMSLDKMYMLTYAATEIVQMAGRPVRHRDDRAEVFITDSAAGGLFKWGTKLFPRWFLEAKKYTTHLPQPLRKI